MRTTGAFLRRHWVFCAAFALGLAIRVITILGFPPAIWFGGDSASYISTALRLSPGTSRLSGYGLMLAVLRPFHSVLLVACVQHLMGLAVAVMIYALLRRYGLPGWGATLGSLVVLLDGYQIQLEHEILPSAPFVFLVVCALTLVLWWRTGRPAWATAAAGVLLAVAATLWPVGLPLLVLYLLYLLIRWVGWQVFAATVAAAAVPLVMYLLWFDAAQHHLAFSNSDGIYLWSRTMTFANCDVIKPPADELALCPRQPVSQRPAASTFIWEADSPLNSVPGPKFSVRKNALALNFALRAIEAQPGGYLADVAHDAGLSFTWNRPDHPSPLISHRYEFGYATTQWASPELVIAAGRTLAQDQRTYGGTGTATRAVAPFAGWMVNYQRYVYLRGTLVAVILAIGLGGIARSWRGGGLRRRRGWGGPALLPWASAVTLLVVPVMTADFDLRYALLAVAPACLAAGLAFAKAPAPAVPEPVSGEAQQPAVPAPRG